MGLSARHADQSAGQTSAARNRHFRRRQAGRRRLARIAAEQALLDREAQAAHGLDHPRSGELVAVAAPDRWFTYSNWLDDARMPDFARTVDIHRKPGYDPVELFVDPTLALPRLRIAATLARKLLGFRYLMKVIGTDASIVRGSHGRLPDRPEDGPVFLCTDAAARRESLPMTDVRDTLLDLVARG